MDDYANAVGRIVGGLVPDSMLGIVGRLEKLGTSPVDAAQEVRSCMGYVQAVQLELQRRGHWISGADYEIVECFVNKEPVSIAVTKVIATKRSADLARQALRPEGLLFSPTPGKLFSAGTMGLGLFFIIGGIENAAWMQMARGSVGSKSLYFLGGLLIVLGFAGFFVKKPG